MIRCAVVAGLLYGCHVDDTGTPADAAGSGSGSSAALSIGWKAAPGSWPGEINSKVTIEDARFAFDNLRVIGDAGPGDPRTTQSAFEIHWNDNTAPSAIDFADAPIGLYSQLSLQMAGLQLLENSYEIRGTVEINGDPTDFRIEDKIPLPLALQIDEMLLPGKSVKIELEIDFVHALSAVDFESLEFNNGHLELHETDLAIIAFRKKLVESFKPTQSSGVGPSH